MAMHVVDTVADHGKLRYLYSKRRVRIVQHSRCSRQLSILIIDPSMEPLDLNIQSCEFLTSVNDFEKLHRDLSICPDSPRLAEDIVPRVLEELKVPYPSV